MSKLLISAVKDFVNNKLAIRLQNKEEVFYIALDDRNTQTTPFPGSFVEEEGIIRMIDFLQKTLIEGGEYE